MIADAVPTRLIEALHAFAAAADRLFESCAAADQVDASIEGVHRTLARVKSLSPECQEIDEAAVWLVDARACLNLRDEDGLRHAANRMYEAALLLVGYHLPPALTIMLVARTMLRDIIGAVQRGDDMRAVKRCLRHVHRLVARVLMRHRGAREQALVAAEEKVARAQVAFEAGDCASRLAEAVSAALEAVGRVVKEMQADTSRTFTYPPKRTRSSS
ncbi:MAG TPA: hypothetical protein VFP65_25235 [Anaeromyxobacteraceae bacterium]|nr:hypothetical protein [Anaeromyxobacteraceae bacterium]